MFKDDYGYTGDSDLQYIHKLQTELKKYKTAYNTAMTTLEQIASTPRNTKAKLHAKGALVFLQTQMKEQDET
jgi:hypothetical protein